MAGAHEALVSRELFDVVQETLRRNSERNMSASMLASRLPFGTPPFDFSFAGVGVVPLIAMITQNVLLVNKRKQLLPRSRSNSGDHGPIFSG